MFLVKFGFSQSNLIHYTVKNGLPQMQCVNLYQDSKGYIWIGTKVGLSRFDGIKFENYGLEDGMSSASISGIIEDNDNNLIFLTTHSVCKFVNDSIVEYKLADTLKISFNSQKNIFVDNQNNIHFLAISQTGIEYLLQLRNHKIENSNCSFSKQNYHISSVFYNSSDNIIELTVTIVGKEKSLFFKIKNNSIIEEINYSASSRISSNGLFLINYHKINKIVSTYNVFEKKNEEFIFVKEIKTSIYDIVRLKDSSIVMIGYFNLDIYDKNWKLKYHYNFEQRNWNFLIDKEENIWVANEGGLYKYSIFFNYNTQNSDIIPYIWGINEDNKGNLYFASYGNGLCKLNYNNEFEAIDTKINNHKIRNFYYSSPKLKNGDMTFVTGGGVYLLSDKFEKLLDIKQVMASCVDTANNSILFAGHDDGIFQYNEKTKKLKKIADILGVLSMQVNKKNQLWYSCGKGLGYISKTDTQFISIKDEKLRAPFSITLDKYDNVWIGCVNGLYFYDHQNFYRINHLELQNLILSVTEINSENIIYGGKTGIGILNLSKFYIHYSLVKNFRFFNKEIDAEKFVDYYSESQGFMGEEIGQNGIFKDSKGRIWVPTSTNVVMFDPKDLYKNETPPYMYINGIFVSDDLINWSNLSDTISDLIHKKNNLRFEFIGINHNAPELVKYKYRLLGYNNEWSNITKERNIIYTNLKPGKYTFQVLACNENGIWNEQPREKYFSIIPAWYQTWLFKIVFPIFILIIFFIVVRYSILKRQKTIQKQKEQESEFRKLKLANIRSQIYPHFFFNSLSAIMSILYKEDKETAYKFFLKLSHQVRESLKDSKRTYKTLKEEIDFVDNYLSIQKFRFHHKFDYDVEISPETNLDILIPPVLIQTFAENAVSHGIEPLKKDGKIKIQISNTNNHIEITVEDNGIGRKKAPETKYKSTGIGLENLNDSIRFFNDENKAKINYEIIDKLEDETGTKIIITIKNGK